MRGVTGGLCGASTGTGGLAGAATAFGGEGLATGAVGAGMAIMTLMGSSGFNVGFDV
jgi:hypothetical protein